MPSDSKKKRDAKRKDGSKSNSSNGTSASTSVNSKGVKINELTLEGKLHYSIYKQTFCCRILQVKVNFA
jgi:hypothetical protein